VKTSPTCLFCLLIFTTSVRPASQASQPFSLTIQPVQERLRSGSQVELKLTLINTSNTEITLRDTNRWCNYALEVRDSQGRLAPEANYRRDLRCGNPVAVTVGRRIIRVLKPGQSYEDTMVVNQTYDFSHPGEYSIQVMRDIPKELGRGVVKSNEIRIIIAN
jgi:hypothetical protein